MNSNAKTSKPVWAHGSGKVQDVRERIVSFCAGRDVAGLPACDQALVQQDIATNEAALLALSKAGILNSDEAKKLAQALIELRGDLDSDPFVLDPDLEDVHINIEQALRQKAGDCAGKLHSGRSRNDQVACDLRLWHREKILTHLGETLGLLSLWLEQGEAEKGTVMPGFTHHQRAFITTWGHLLVSYVQAWLRDIERGWGVFERTNRSPIGAAAGFGTSWPLDRELMASWLGFDSVLENSADSVSSRIEVETDIAAWLAIWMNHCSLVAQDLILFSMEEFQWVALATEVTTGSSIMPQKRNPDFAEVIKGKTSLVHGILTSLLSMAKGQPSGYHRDSQYSKPLGQDLWREIEGVPTVLETVYGSLKLDRKAMKEATKGGFLEAAEWADTISRESGLPFREVYAVIGQAVDRCRKTGTLTRVAVNATLERNGLDYRVSVPTAKQLAHPEGLLEGRVSQGSPNPNRVQEQIESMAGSVQSWERKIRKAEKAIEKKNLERGREIEKLL
ncbi:MAG: argininosuccinate lyase [Candidatus Omnitrophica bacterium]|nr:argininosuccinate lyase [Candidatus Omnitrophota bacterium]